jgi:hypothetical protein
MVVRSAQKNMDDVQKIWAAIEGNKPVITVAQQELIVKYADVIGEDGKAMIEVIEEEARKPDAMPADIFKLIERCLTSLSQKAKRQGLSDEVIKQREPVRLLQVEAIREHATMLHANRLNGEKLGEESVRKAMKKLVDEYMAAVEQDKEDGLDPDTARMWKEQVQEIAAQARLDQPVASCGVSNSGPVAHPRVKDRLTPPKVSHRASDLHHAGRDEGVDGPQRDCSAWIRQAVRKLEEGDNGCKQGPRGGPASRRGNGGDPAGERVMVIA